MNKCIKGESCIHCNTDYCRFVDEIKEFQAENERLKECLKEIKEIAEKRNYLNKDEALDDILNKISEVFND